MKRLAVFFAAGAAFAQAAFGGLTLDEDFGGRELALGPEGSGWAANAATLVGVNRGSIFFDVRFSTPDPAYMRQRTVMSLRTASRLTVGFFSYGNNTLQFTFGDGDRRFLHTFSEKIERERIYRLGVTWDGDVVRIYRDGRAIISALQPQAFKPGIVRKLYLGPYADGWFRISPWSKDVFISRLRVWNEARTPADVAEEAGIVFKPLAEDVAPRLTVPQLSEGVAAPSIDGRLDDAAWKRAGSMPQLIRGNFTGKSGQLPPHGFRLAYDAKNLYLGAFTHFPPHDPIVEGLLRVDGQEPEAWGTESFEFWLECGGHRFRFTANAAGGTSESRDGKKPWNGEWKYADSKEMKIDDSILWQCEAAIPWKTLGMDGPPKADARTRLNFARTWTLSTLGGFSSLDLTGRGYSDVKTWPEVDFAPAVSFRLSKRTDPSSGGYRQESEISAPRKAKVRYTLSLARLDGSLAPMPLYSREGVLTAGETVNDLVDVRTDVPGYDALLHVLEADGKTLMREIVPYALNPELFAVTPLLLAEKVRVTPKKPLSGEFRLVAPDGSVKDRKDASAGEAVFAFPRSNAAGTWRVEFSGDGKAAGVKTFSYPGVGEWERQDFHEDWVLPPFTPLRSAVEKEGLAVSLYARDYAWRKSLLPSRVKTLGDEMFAEPPALLVGGEPAACASFAVVSNAPHRAALEASGGNGKVDVALQGWIEYDGLQWNDVKVTPRAPNLSLQVRYVLKPAFAKYLHAASGSGWGAKRTMALAEGRQTLGDFPILWTGNEEKGWTFFYETRDGWDAVAKRTYDLEKTGDRLTVTVDIARKLPAGKTFEFSFGFQATPVRPRAANYPFDIVGWSWVAPMIRPGRRPTCDAVYLFAKGGDLGSFFGDQDTDDGRKTEAAMTRALAACEGTGVRPMFYTASRFLSVRYPEVAAYIPEWMFKPEVAMDYSHTGHFVYDCCPTTKASDFFMWRFRDVLRRHPGMKGIYLDFGVVHPCSNRDHGCRSKTPILGMREFYRRLAVVQLEAGIKEPLTVIHNTDCVQVPAVSFVTHLVNGEHIRQASSPILHNKKDILDSYGLEMFACELSTLPFGISNSAYMPFDELSKVNGGDEGVEDYTFRMTRASLAGTLAHGSIQCTWRNHYGIFDKLVRAYERFGADKADFIGYWRHPAAVADAQDVYVSCYVKDGKALAVVSHLGKPHVDQTPVITFDWAKLGVTPPTKAVDVMTAPDPEYDELFARRAKARIPVSRVSLKLGDFGTKVESFDGKTLKLRLPYHTFSLVEFSR